MAKNQSGQSLKGLVEWRCFPPSMQKSTLIAAVILIAFIAMGLVFSIMNEGQLEGRFSTETLQNN